MCSIVLTECSILDSLALSVRSVSLHIHEGGDAVQIAVPQGLHVHGVGDAFGIDLERQAAQHDHETAHEGGACRVARHPLHDRGIELHEVEPGLVEPFDLGQARPCMFNAELDAQRAKLASVMTSVVLNCVASSSAGVSTRVTSEFDRIGMIFESRLLCRPLLV